MGNNPGNEYNRYRHMDVKKPAKGIFSDFGPGTAEGKVDQKGQNKECQDSVKFTIKYHLTKITERCA